VTSWRREEWVDLQNAILGSSRSDTCFFPNLTLLQITLTHSYSYLSVTMSIMLSFGGSSANGAWDDRELVSAYDTAMEEFHVSPLPHLRALKADLAGSPPWTRLMARQGHGSEGIGEPSWLVEPSKSSVSPIYMGPKHRELTIQMVCRARNDTRSARGGRA